MVSMKDIAKKCGVSVATVSKALNDQSDIAKSTKNQICKIAKEMGYVANANARTLKTNKTKNIGVVFVDAQNAGLGHEFFSNILESFRAEAEKHDYDITFINNSGKSDTYLKHCLYRQFDGVVIIYALMNDQGVQELIDSDIPVVSVDTAYKNCCSVISDNMVGLLKLTEYAIEMGHKDIVFMTGENTEVTSYRLMGFYKAMFDHQLPINPNNIYEAGYHDLKKCYEKTQQVLQREQLPSCIIFPDDYSYYGGMQALIEKGLVIGEDISVIGYDGINMALANGLTTYKQDAYQLGKIAAQNLIEMIETGRTFNENVVVSGELIQGKTVKNIN